MKEKTGKKELLWRGLSGVFAFLLAFATFGSACAKSYEAKINSFLGKQNRGRLLCHLRIRNAACHLQSLYYF